MTAASATKRTREIHTGEIISPTNHTAPTASLALNGQGRTYKILTPMEREELKGKMHFVGKQIDAAYEAQDYYSEAQGRAEYHQLYKRWQEHYRLSAEGELELARKEFSTKFEEEKKSWETKMGELNRHLEQGDGEIAILRQQLEDAQGERDKLKRKNDLLEEAAIEHAKKREALEHDIQVGRAENVDAKKTIAEQTLTISSMTTELRVRLNKIRELDGSAAESARKNRRMKLTN